MNETPENFILTQNKTSERSLLGVILGIEVRINFDTSGPSAIDSSHKTTPRSDLFDVLLCVKMKFSGVPFILTHM